MRNREITLALNNKVFCDLSKIVANDMDGETVMMNIEKGKYYGLDPVASRVWQLIQKPITIDELMTVLLTEYDVSSDVLKKDIFSFIGKLEKEGMLKIVD